MAALGRKGELPEGGAAGAADEDAAAALRREADQADQEALDLSAGREAPDAGLAGGRARADAADMPILKRELFGSDADWFDGQLSFARSQGLLPEGPPELAGGAAAAGQPEVAGGAPARPQTLQQWFAGSMIADERGRPLTVYHGSGSEFDTFDVARAGEGRGSTGEQALFFSTDPDVASHSALVAGAGHATNEPTHTGAFADNGGVVYPVHLRVENPLISKLKFYNGEEFAKEIARAKAAGHDGVIFPHVTSRGENGTVAVFNPDQVRSIFADAAQVRIDEPALKAFEDPRGGGFAELAESLEHDYRAQLTDPERAKRTYEVGDKRITLAELLDEFDRDREAAAALRACAGAGA